MVRFGCFFLCKLLEPSPQLFLLRLSTAFLFSGFSLTLLTAGEKIGKALPIAPDDLINIAGLSQVPDGVASWHVAVSKYTDSPLLSAALPVWDPSKESIVAVVGVTTALYSVGQLMKELVEFHSGHIYLTSQEGYLLATSTNTPLLNNTLKGPKLMMAIDSQDSVIRSGAEWLNRTYGDNYPPSHEVHVENARLGDQHYYIDSFFLNLKRLPLVNLRTILFPLALLLSFKTFPDDGKFPGVLRFLKIFHFPETIF